jgi:hypothetical protein
MEPIQFISKYTDYLQEIREVVKPEYYSVIDQLMRIDPHDLVTPDSWFMSESSVRGFVWTMFLNKSKSIQSIKV